MKLLENYNSAKQKYGEKLVRAMVNNGIPDKYLLSSCRFYTEDNVPIPRLKQLFRQWLTYVVKVNNAIDVNRLSFINFVETIQQFKLEYQIPNIVYKDSKVCVGKILSARDVSKLPISNTWCIKQPGMFQKYIDNGCSFYLIDNGNNSDYIRYVVLMLDKAGKKYYYDLENIQLDKDDIEELKTYLTPQSITFISNLQENKNHNIPFDNNNSQAIIKEVEETKKKILSLMERMGDNTEYLSVENIGEYQNFTPVSYNTEITLHNGRKTKSYVGISNGISTFHIASDDGCYVVYHKDNESPDGRMSEEPCNHLQPFIIQELKKLPNSPV